MADAKGGNFGTLSWGMGLDTKDFKKKMKDIRKKTKSFGQNMSASFVKIGKAFAGVGLAAGASAAGILLFTKNSLEATNAQILLADSIGVTQGDVAALELSATKFGVSQDMLIDKMREFGGLDEFNKLADQVKNAGDESAQLAKAQELLGNEGLKLLPILQQGSEGFAAMKREAGELGLALSPTQVEESRIAWEQYESTILSIKGLGTQLAQAFLKPLGNIAAGVEAFVKTFKDDIIAGFTFVSEGMTTLIRGAIDLFSRYGIPFINAFISFAGQIGGAFQTLFDYLSPATKGAVGGFGALFSGITDFIATFKQSMIIGITKPIEFVIKGVFGSLSFMIKELGLLIGGFAQRMAMMKVISQETADNIGGFFHESGNKLSKLGQNLSKPFVDAQAEAEKNMVDILTKKYKKDQEQQIKFKGLVGEFSVNFGKAAANAAAKASKKVSKVVSDSFGTSVSDKFAGLALSGSQEEANLMRVGKTAQIQKDQLRELAGIKKAVNKIGVV